MNRLKISGFPLHFPALWLLSCGGWRHGQWNLIVQKKVQFNRQPAGKLWVVAKALQKPWRRKIVSGVVTGQQWDYHFVDSWFTDLTLSKLVMYINPCFGTKIFANFEAWCNCNIYRSVRMLKVFRLSMSQRYDELSKFSGVSGTRQWRRFARVHIRLPDSIELGRW